MNHVSRDSLGELEHMVLLTVLRLGGEAYSVSVVLELEDRTGREVAQAAVFIAMKRLEKKGFLESRLDDHAVKETGRVRRYFELTPAGEEKLRERREALVSLWEGVTTQLDRA
jgi:DNA-binding PadR family transcriptional regulator